MGFSRQEYWSGLPFPSPSHSVMSNSLRIHELYSPWNSLDQNTGVGSLSLLQQIFLTHQTSVSCIAGGFFTNWLIREAQVYSDNFSQNSLNILYFAFFRWVRKMLMAHCRKSLWDAEFIVALWKTQFVILLKITWKRTKHFDLGLVPQEILHRNQIAFNKCLLYWGHRFTLKVHSVHWERQKTEGGMEFLSLVQAAPCEWGRQCTLNPCGGNAASSTLTRVGLSLPTFQQLHKSNSYVSRWNSEKPTLLLTPVPPPLAFPYNHSWRRKWQPTPIILSGESHRQRSLAGYSPWVIYL